MRNFNNDDFNEDEFGEDFFSRWEEFNRMMNDRRFRKDINKFNLEELMRLIAKSREDGNPMGMRIIPLGDFNKDDFKFPNIPQDEINSEEGEDENGKWETKNWTSPDGSMSFTSFTRSSSNGDETDIPDEMANEWAMKLRDRETKRMNPEDAKKLKLAKLNRALEYLVSEEKYEKAAEIKKLIDDLNSEKEETKEN